MAIQYSSDRIYHATPDSLGVAQNLASFTEYFKIRVDSANPGSIPGADQSLFCAMTIFKAWHDFQASFPPNVTMRLHIGCQGGTPQVDYSLIPGIIYDIVVSHDGANQSQVAWVNGVKNKFGSASGYSNDRSDPFFLGLFTPNPNVNITIEDLTVYNDYVANATDVGNLIAGNSPTGIGPSASRIFYWSLKGPSGTVPVIGDNGLKNAYGTGPDFNSIVGTGTALYTSNLSSFRIPVKTAYIGPGGSEVIIFLQDQLGNTVSPTQLNVAPTINIDGTGTLTLENPWFTGYHPFAFYVLPSGQVLTQKNVTTLSAPAIWANTTLGATAPITNAPVINLTDQDFPFLSGSPTLRIGMNLPQAPMSTNLGFYYPFKNFKYKVNWPPGNRGKYTTTFNQITFTWLADGNALHDGTFYPGTTGLYLTRWDSTGNHLEPTQFFISSSNSNAIVTERLDLLTSGINGIGMCRVFDVQHAYPTGDRSFNLCLGCSDPSEIPNYDNFWLCLQNDFSIVSGKPYLDISDPWVLSTYFTSRIPSGVGSLRGVDSTPCGGNPLSIPLPEDLPAPTDEAWGDLSASYRTIGIESVGWVNTTQTPYIYSPFLTGVVNFYSATLSSPITNILPQDTKQTIIIPDAQTAPVFPSCELYIDSEVYRVISVSGSSVVVNTGSNRTIPSTHATGIIKVSGRTLISDVLHSSGPTGYQIGAVVLGIVTSGNHMLMTGDTISFDGAAMPTVHFNTGEVYQPFVRQVYSTGPNTAFQIFQSSYSTSGATAIQNYNLDPNLYYWLRIGPYADLMPVEMLCKIASYFPLCNVHINLPNNGCFDMTRAYAKKVINWFPPGRKVILEWSNEPWNFAFAPFYYMTGMMGPLVLGANNTELNAYYPYQASNHAALFIKEFSDVGRGSEVEWLLNCQMGNPDVQNHLNFCKNNNIVPNYIALAPYWRPEPTAYNQAKFNTYTDEQWCTVALLDLLFNPNYMNPSLDQPIAAINSFNNSTGKNVKLMCYEGNPEFMAPIGFDGTIGSMIFPYERTQDIMYNPKMIHVKNAQYDWLESKGVQYHHDYCFSLFYGAQAWGEYHSLDQPRGSGLNNYLYKANPLSPNFKGVGVSQDEHCESVAGQAFWERLLKIDSSNSGSNPIISFSHHYHTIVRAGRSVIRFLSR